MTHRIFTELVKILGELRRDERGQDMIEYALLGCSGFLAVAVVLPQQMLPTLSTIFSQIGSTLANASHGS